MIILLKMDNYNLHFDAYVIMVERIVSVIILGVFLIFRRSVFLPIFMHNLTTQYYFCQLILNRLSNSRLS